MSTKLEDLLISEVSAVDSPANESDGWLLMKRRGPALADLLKTVDAMLAIGTINDALVSKDAAYTKDELAALTTSLLEQFATLSIEDRKEMLVVLNPDVRKAMGNAYLLSQATRNVPTAEDGIFTLIHRTGRRIVAT
jgi:hypothetical protein